MIPPTMVYTTTPIGKRKHAAAVGMPVSSDTTAEPPVRSMAVTVIGVSARRYTIEDSIPRMFVKIENIMYTLRPSRLAGERARVLLLPLTHV